VVFIFLLLFQLLGCIVIGYMAWVLATSVTVSKFVDGSMVSSTVKLEIALKKKDFSYFRETLLFALCLKLLDAFAKSWQNISKTFVKFLLKYENKSIHLHTSKE
jgi:hypothetical protein